MNITKVQSISHPDAIARALQVIQQGGLVAFPTDTVYGVGTSIKDPLAIQKLYAVKQRDQTKAIPVLLGNTADLDKVADMVNPPAQRLINDFWPGPLTIILMRNPHLPHILSLNDTIGVRMPDHPAALDLLGQAGPLAVTSANLSGSPDSCTAQEVNKQLGGTIDLILDGGKTPGGIPSTVVDCTGDRCVLLRQGPITFQAILNSLG